MITTGILKRSIIPGGEKENNVASEDQRVQELKKRFNNLGVSVEKNKKVKKDAKKPGIPAAVKKA